jgi:hypothetical protein
MVTNTAVWYKYPFGKGVTGIGKVEQARWYLEIIRKCASENARIVS